MRRFFLLLSLVVLASSGALALEPRTGPITVVQVAVPSPEALNALSRQFVVDSYRDGLATIYADDADLAALRQQGYSYTVVPPEPKVFGVYHTYSSLTTDLQAYAAAYPGITRLVSLGKSVQGRDLWAMLITNNPDTQEDEPEFKYIGSMHGDEPVGMELLLYLIDLLVKGYGQDERITQLVDGTAIWILPLMNPDGLQSNSRFNAQGLDLNRTFPSYPSDFTGNIYDDTNNDVSLEQYLTGRPPEVQAVMQWTAANSFTLSANFHTGSLIVNYPYDDDGGPSGVAAPTPEDAMFRDIALRYSTHNLPMYNNPLDPDSPQHPDGITNGQAWYIVESGMQDWNYRYASDNEVTIELSNTKKPSASALAQLWENNRESMLSYMEAVNIGVRGVVTDGAEPVYAKVQVVGNPHPVFTDPDVGDYHRMLLPGTYSLLFSAPRYLTKTRHNVTVQDGPATRLDEVLVAAVDDVSGDGKMDALDVQMVINAALGLPSLPACDIDGGGVTASDVQIVINGVLHS